MKLFLPKNKLSPIQKITFAGLLIALVIVLQKVLAINYIPFIPFLRISLGGPCIIIFASIFLGPFYGAVVGAASDVLGYLIFDPKTYAPFPQITMIYLALGFLSYFVFALVKKIKNPKLVLPIEITILTFLTTICSVYFCMNSSINLYGQIYTILNWQKIIIPIAMIVLSAGIVTFTVLFRKINKDKVSTFSSNQMSLALLIIEILIMGFFGTIMKAQAFGYQTFFVILICQIFTGFINLFINSFLLYTLLKLTKNKLYFEERSLFI